MSNLPEDIDKFFKENIDNIEVKFNPAHWDKLQQALTSTPPVSNPSPVIKKSVTLKKLLLIGIPSAVIISLGIYYFSSSKQVTNSKDVIIKTDSTLKNNLIEPDTIKALGKNIFNLNNITLPPDSNKKATQPVLFFSTEKDSLINSLKKDRVHTTKSDTTQKQNKKKPDPFW